jgi:hypothetical protein
MKGAEEVVVRGGREIKCAERAAMDGDDIVEPQG